MLPSAYVLVADSTHLRPQQTVEQWRKVFWLCVPVYVACEVFYIVFASAARQPWDQPSHGGRENVNEKEEEEKENSVFLEEGKVL